MVLFGSVDIAGQSQPPVCHDGATTWEGICVRSEPVGPRTGYVRASHADSEAEIIRRLPANMRVQAGLGGHQTTAFWTPYGCTRIAVNTKGKASTDIEHIVALAEAHDSGLDPSQRHALANDLLNQTVAVASVNRSKGSKDAAEWQPLNNGGWFAMRVIQVKRKYGLSVDSAEATALTRLLSGGRSTHLECP